MQKISLHYYVLPEQIVYFQKVNQNTRVVFPEQIFSDKSSEAIMDALKYRFGLGYLGKQYQQLFVLCIPARQLRIEENSNHQQQVLQIIKTSKQTEIKGYASGRRSAILIKGDKFIRFKGCGNDTQGFIFENKGLRGSHFFHTAKREMYMTTLINKILQEQIQQQSANKPLYFYQFSNSIAKLDLKNDLKLLNKYCCVFETQGDRRVGTHLISPLEIIFLNIINQSSDNLVNFFKSKQRLDEFGLTQLLINFELFLEKGDNFLSIYDKSTEFDNYVTLNDYLIFSGQTIHQKQDFHMIITKIQDKFIKLKETKAHQLLEQKINWINIIDIILQKLGWEMGQTKRIFCQKEINWGFFNDHGYWHCNAHLNNFIIKHPQKDQKFILPLDFDLAFTKEQYINIDLQSQNYGENDPDNFQQLLLSEYNSMEMSVSGLEIMNFKYSIEEQNGLPTNQVKMARIIFRDTLVCSFRWGMRKNHQQYERINKLWNQNLGQIQKLVEFCLITSANFQT